MAKIKHKNMIIEVVPNKSGKITSKVIESGDTPENEVALLNKHLQALADVYHPRPGDFVISASNAIAGWIANGLKAEVVEYDEVKLDPHVIY